MHSATHRSASGEDEYGTLLSTPIPSDAISTPCFLVRLLVLPTDTLFTQIELAIRLAETDLNAIEPNLLGKRQSAGLTTADRSTNRMRRS